MFIHYHFHKTYPSKFEELPLKGSNCAIFIRIWIASIRFPHLSSLHSMSSSLPHAPFTWRQRRHQPPPGTMPRSRHAPLLDPPAVALPNQSSFASTIPEPLWCPLWGRTVEEADNDYMRTTTLVSILTCWGGHSLLLGENMDNVNAKSTTLLTLVDHRGVGESVLSALVIF